MSGSGGGRAAKTAGEAVIGCSLKLFYHPEARQLVESLAPFLEIEESPQQPSGESGFYLWATADQVALCRGRGRGVWVTLAELARRAAQGAELTRACGVGSGGSARILDPMAGWGVDALVLARRGCSVQLVEHHPALWVLQQDLIRRSGLKVGAARCGDGFDAFESQDDWDVVYLDPMFPARSKSALPGKRMQWLAELAPPDRRPLALWLERAVAVARERVVLKRRRRDPLVRDPDWQIVGRTVRYDVYRGAAAARG